MLGLISFCQKGWMWILCINSQSIPLFSLDSNFFEKLSISINSSINGACSCIGIHRYIIQG